MPLSRFFRWLQRGLRNARRPSAITLQELHSGNFDASYGNSAFGAWVTDEFGLPAFRYDGCAAGSGCEEPADPCHQLGNGHVTAVAHVGGYVELFTAKTYYRYANRYDATAKHFAGGFGWIRENGNVWSTFYDDRPSGSTYERLFGMGYYKKTIEHGGLRVEQYIYAAPGGDEALLERLVLTNLSGTTKSLQYFDYWDVAWWLVRYSDPVTSASAYDPARVRTSYDAARAAIKVTSLAPPGDLHIPSLVRDPSPKTAFVAYLGDTPDRFDSVQAEFFGPTGDRLLPRRVRPGEQLGNSTSDNLPNEDATLVTQKDVMLAPGGKHELHILYGIAPRGEEDAVIDRYRSSPANRLPEIAQDWATRIPRLVLPEERWIEREMAWSAYYLLSGMMREDFFATRATNQGSIYQYLWGANAGPRAALRHVMPIIYIDPKAAREVITYYLRAMKETGELAYATAGYGAWQPMGFDPSDSALWLLWAAAEYVFATRDFAFLDTVHDYYCEAGRGGCDKAKAYDMLKQAFAYQVAHVGTGAHGLVQLKKWDWDDLLVSNFGPYDETRSVNEGESTLNTALAVVAYPMLAALAERRGDTAFAAHVREHCLSLKNALRDQWRNDHFNRAYVYGLLGPAVELGKDDLWLAANAFALIADGLLGQDEATRLIDRMRRELLDSSPLGLASQAAPMANIGTSGFWYSLAGPAVEGLAKQNNIPGARDLAWSAFRRQTLATHAQEYPNIWYGVWSGPDMYYTPLDVTMSPYDPCPGLGKTWCYVFQILFIKVRLCMRDFPVFNMFAHSEPLLGSVRMAGLWADAGGLIIDPIFPFETFKWESAVARTPAETQGRITPTDDDVLNMRVRIRGGTPKPTLAVSVNGQSAPFTYDATTGFVQFSLRVTRDIAATWSVRSNV
jgi:hypothetical protein